jgi:hypothetical protein
MGNSPAGAQPSLTFGPASATISSGSFASLSTELTLHLRADLKRAKTRPLQPRRAADRRDTKRSIRHTLEQREIKLRVVKVDVRA